MLRTKRFSSGDWRTVEWFFGGAGTAFFKAPAGSKIKVRYGLGWFGVDRQVQTLNGGEYKKLQVGGASFTRARMQIKVPQTADVTYDVYPDGSNPSVPLNPF